MSFTGWWVNGKNQINYVVIALGFNENDNLNF